MGSIAFTDFGRHSQTKRRNFNGAVLRANDEVLAIFGESMEGTDLKQHLQRTVAPKVKHDSTCRNGANIFGVVKSNEAWHRPAVVGKQGFQRRASKCSTNAETQLPVAHDLLGSLHVVCCQQWRRH